MAEPSSSFESAPGGYVLLGTPETVERLGWVGARLPEIAQADVLVITREDIIPRGRLAAKGLDEVEYGTRRLMEIFEKHVGEPLTLEDAQMMRPFVENALNNVAAANGQDLDGDGKNDFGIITTHNLSMSPEQHLGEMAGINPELIKYAPGTSYDYTAWTMFHEARHISQNDVGDYYESTPVPFEADADREAIIQMERAKAEGLPVNVEVSRAMQEARVLNGQPYDTIENFGRALANLDFGKLVSSHSTHFMTEQDPTVDTVLPRDNKIDSKTTLVVNSMVSNAVGLYLQMRAAQELSPNFPEDKKMFGTDAYLELATDPKKLSESAAIVMRDDPALAQTVLSALREKNYIKDGTPEAVYADRVLGFFEKHIDAEAINDDQMETLRDGLKEFITALPEADKLPIAAPLNNILPTGEPVAAADSKRLPEPGR